MGWGIGLLPSLDIKLHFTFSCIATRVLDLPILLFPHAREQERRVAKLREKVVVMFFATYHPSSYHGFLSTSVIAI